MKHERQPEASKPEETQHESPTETGPVNASPEGGKQTEDVEDSAPEHPSGRKREPWERVQKAGEEQEEEQKLLGTLPRITLGTGLVLTLLVIGYLAIYGLGRLPYEPEWPVPGGDPKRGETLIQSYGCGSCHRIPGIANANGRVGPILSDLSEQVYIGGQLPNTPDHLSEWIQNPQRFAPGTAMPNLGVTEPEAQDIAAYLHRKT